MNSQMIDLAFGAKCGAFSTAPAGLSRPRRYVSASAPHPRPDVRRNSRRARGSSGVIVFSIHHPPHPPTSPRREQGFFTSGPCSRRGLVGGVVIVMISIDVKEFVQAEEHMAEV